MPNDPRFDPNTPGWPNLAWPRTGPFGGPANPDYWTDPFTNQHTVAPVTPAPFSAAQLGAMAWHPPVFLPPNPFSPANIPASKWLTPLPIFLNSPSQFPPTIPAPRDDSPVDGPQGLFGGMPKMLTVSSAVNNPAIDENKGLLGAIERLPFAVPNQPSPAPFPEAQSTTVVGGSPRDLWGSPSADSAYPQPGVDTLTRSVLFNNVPAPWDPGASDRDPANLDHAAQRLGGAELPISKSGTPFVSPPPQLSITPEQWLAAARLLAPNTVDYFTKQLPPAPAFPPTPGKIPSSDNPYAPGAALEAATFLLAPLEGRLATSLASATRGVEMRAAEATLQAAKSVAGSPALASPAAQVLAGASGELSGNLTQEAFDRILAALRAAVASGNLSKEQAAALFQRANSVGEMGSAKSGVLLSSWLPSYDDETTHGLLITNEGNVVPLRSGPPRSFGNYPPSRHAEGKGAIWIRENGSTGGVVYHNNTDGTCGLCNSQLERLLPHKAVLDVVPPPGAIPKNSQAKVKPTWYVGDAAMPKLPPQVQQPDFFGE